MGHIAVLILVVVGFLLMLILPLLPGLLELRTPTDDDPPMIRLEYTKDPRYFGRSFRSIVARTVPMDQPLGECTVEMSRSEEVVRIANAVEISAGEEVEQTLYVADSLRVHDSAILRREVYSRGSVDLGEHCTVRAVAADGILNAASGLKVVRWLDSEREINLASHSDLGMSVSCEGMLRLGFGSSFRRLFGRPVSLGEFFYSEWSLPSAEQQAVLSTEDVKVISDACICVREFRGLPEQIINGDLVSRGDVSIEQLSSVMGSVKAHGAVVLHPGALIMGNLFAEGDIVLKSGSRVLGNVFSQGRILMEADCVIGRPGRVKSLIARRGIRISRGCAIYGYVLSEGPGNTEEL
jgi:NDP-sugar pyrophosphorylase family protein